MDINRWLNEGSIGELWHVTGDAASANAEIRRLDGENVRLKAERVRLPPWLADVGPDGNITRRRVKKGTALHLAGEPFKALYVVCCGKFKRCARFSDGRTQIIGFALSGDLLGIDGIGDGTYATDVIALEDSEAGALNYKAKFGSAETPTYHCDALLRIASRELVREQTMLTHLGVMRVEERVASFLLSYSARMAARGFSSTRFVLPVSREELGNHLGATLETISRVLNRFQRRSLIAFSDGKREITLLNVEGLRCVAFESKRDSTSIGSQARYA